jgi:hypothetical protein
MKQKVLIHAFRKVIVVLLKLGSAMNSDEWELLKEPIHDELYEDLHETIQCGPFDGGCVIVAQALQRVLGGELYGLVDANDMPGHAVVMHEGMLWDYDGPLSPSEFMERFIRLECPPGAWRPVSYRPMNGDELQDAFRDEALQDRIEARFRRMLGLDKVAANVSTNMQPI